MKNLFLSLFCLFATQTMFAQNLFNNPEIAYSSPSFQSTAKGELILSWLEKNKEGKSFLLHGNFKG